MLLLPAIAAAEPGEARTSSVGVAETPDPGHDYVREPGRGARRIVEEERPIYRNPQGSVPISGNLSLSTGPLGTRFAVGLGIGYAVLTGVVPGVRGLLITGDGVGGEAAATLTLTPPLSINWTPFLLGEVGRRFEPGGSGWLYGAGAGVFIGDPGGSASIQVGWMLRRYDFNGTVYAANGPIIGINWRI